MVRDAITKAPALSHLFSTDPIPPTGEIYTKAEMMITATKKEFTDQVNNASHNDNGLFHIETVDNRETAVGQSRQLHQITPAAFEKGLEKQDIA